MKKFTIIVIVIIQFTISIAFSGEEIDKLFYYVCKKNVEIVKVINHNGQYYVVIKLSEKASKSFAEMTGENINKRLQILVDYYLIADIIIPNRTEAGAIRSGPMTEENALKVQQHLLDNDGLRCGFPEVAIQENIWKPHLKKYLEDNYPRVDEVIAQDIVRTKNGTKGHILIDGEINPVRQPQGETKEERVVQVVKDILMQEKELFGFKSEEEIRVDKVSILSFPRGKEYKINISRYIGDVNVASHFFMAHVSEHEKITYLVGTMDRVLPEVYDLAFQPMIDKQTVESTIIADCKKTKQDTKTISIRYLGKIAVNEDPFIIWHGECAHYVYEIDAFTGKLFKKVKIQPKE